MPRRLVHTVAVPAPTAEEILAAARPQRLILPARSVEIALLDWGGDGPLALLHHANGFSKGVWGLVAWELRARFRVLAMDARGHGDSSRPADPDAYRWEELAADVGAVAAALAREHGRGVALGIGHSFGGTAMLGAAARDPERFGRLLLVDPVTPAPPSVALPPERRQYARRLVEGARKRRATWPSRAEARAHLGARSLFARADPRALDLYVLDALRERPDGSVELKCAPETEATLFSQSRAIDVFAWARDLVPRTLFLWAARGDFPRPVYEALAASMRDATVETVPTGHLVPLERPDLVAEAAIRLATT